jgi:transposase
MDLSLRNDHVGGMNSERKTYPLDVTDEEWVLVAPYLTLLSKDAGQREHSLREVFNGLRYIVKTGAPWRWMPNDLPPWSAVYQQTQRWLAAGCFEALAHDLRAVLRQASGRSPEPSAAILDSRTLRSSPESGERAGYDGAKRKKGSKLHVAVDTLGHVLALHVTSANTDDRAEVSRLVDAAQEASQGNLEVAFADQGYTGEKAEAAASEQGVELVIVRLPEAKRGFVLLPIRWVAERSLAWTTRFRRLVRDYERYASTLAGLHFVAFACLMLKQAAALMGSS